MDALGLAEAVPLMEVASLRPRRDPRSRLVVRLLSAGVSRGGAKPRNEVWGLRLRVGNSRQRHDPANKAPPPPDLVSLSRGGCQSPRPQRGQLQRRESSIGGRSAGVGVADPEALTCWKAGGALSSTVATLDWLGWRASLRRRRGTNPATLRPYALGERNAQSASTERRPPSIQRSLRWSLPHCFSMLALMSRGPHGEGLCVQRSMNGGGTGGSRRGLGEAAYNMGPENDH